MARTVESTVYQFDKLDEHAKERAREWYRTASASDFDDFNAGVIIDDAANMADMFGLDIRQRRVTLMDKSTRSEPAVYYSGFWSQGDGASFIGRYAYKRGCVRAVESDAPSVWIDRDTGVRTTCDTNARLGRIVRELTDVQRRNFYQLTAQITRSHGAHYAHEMTMSIDVERADERPVSDADADVVRDALRDFARWIYRGLESEYEYQNADAQVDENIRANDYEFTEDGRRA